MRLTRYPVLVATAALALSACSQQADESAAENMKTADLSVESPPQEAAAEAAASAALPDLTDAAPGVAFAYNYAFTLPGLAISRVQQQHAAACGKLGVERCRITGLGFEQPRGGEPTARLDLLIAPELVHSFGTDAAALVEQAEGELSQADVSGTDAGAAIDQSHRRSGAVRAEINRIEARLKVGGLAKETRVELERRLQSLQDELRSEASGRADAERSLATTPMHFAYATEGVLAGGNPFAPAASASLGSAQTALALVLLVAGYLLPWLGLALLGYLGFRFVRIRLAKPASEAQTAA